MPAAAPMAAAAAAAAGILCLQLLQLPRAGAEYIAPPGGYPTGPETCANATGCTPLITDAAGPVPMASYVLWGCIVLSGLVVAVGNTCGPRRTVDSAAGRPARKLSLQAEEDDALMKATGGGGGGGGGGGEASDEAPLLASAASGATEVELADGTRFVGYRKTLRGTVCGVLAALGTAYQVALFIVILTDFYWACEFTGLDNCCLQGAHPIFGDYNVNSKVSSNQSPLPTCSSVAVAAHQVRE